MEIEVDKRSDVVVVTPGTRVDSSNAEELIRRLSEVVGVGCRALVVDLHRVPYVTSAGFRALLVAEDRLRESLGQLVLCGLAPQVRRLFEMGAFIDHFAIVPTLDDALARAGKAGAG